MVPKGWCGGQQMRILKDGADAFVLFLYGTQLVRFEVQCPHST
jgi:hypothetical protein